MVEATSALPFQTVQVGGLSTIAATRSQLAELMIRDCKSISPDGLPRLVFSSNGQGISLASRSPDFAKAMAAADIIHADGMSVVVGAKLFARTALPERVSTTDFFHNAAAAAVAANVSFFVLGGKEEQNRRAVEAMQGLYPGLRVVGRRNGYFKREEEEQICTEIRQSGADVLWVALGKPLQEYWSVRNRENLLGVGWIKTCGGLYGYLAGDEKRAPDWMQKIGLEWFYRTLQDPRRLLWRYLVTNPHAAWCMARLSRQTR